VGKGGLSSGTSYAGRALNQRKITKLGKGSSTDVRVGFLKGFLRRRQKSPTNVRQHTPAGSVHNCSAREIKQIVEGDVRLNKQTWERSLFRGQAQKTRLPSWKIGSTD